MISHMTPHILIRALTLGIAASALTLTSCSTVESRVSDHPEIYNTLSPGDQALVREGKIRAGMSENAVWMAWGAPEQKFGGNMKGRTTETWVYITYETAPYAYPYRPYFGYGFGSGVFIRSHHHHRFAFFGDPFYDPFYTAIPPSVPVPYKAVTFAGGRVLSFQYRMGAQ
ncbi:MAG: hypothetical protein ABI925_12790 [Verrucomicrobiota bacterium]